MLPGVGSNQKQPFAHVLQNRCSSKCRSIPRKTWWSFFWLICRPFVRNSRWVVFYKKSVLKCFPKFIGKNLVRVSSLNVRPTTSLRTRLRHRCFAVNFAKFFRTLFLKKTSGPCFCFVKLLNIIVKSFRSQLTWNIFHKLKKVYWDDAVIL